MPQAIASPDGLERFARELKQFNTQLRDTRSVARLNMISSRGRR
jgi:hypothetical protein